jgi:hypothetical protein
MAGMNNDSSNIYNPSGLVKEVADNPVPSQVRAQNREAARDFVMQRMTIEQEWNLAVAIMTLLSKETVRQNMSN